MEGIFKTSFRTMADTTNAIAYNTRKIGVAALENKQEECVYLTIEYFNTFLRLALNEKNQRSSCGKAFFDHNIAYNTRKIG